MSILKYKYKAHKFINYAFYIVVFIFGFLLGFTTQKLDFNKLISQFLMIDNVSAYTIYEDDNVTINEEFIYNTFLENYDNFNLDDFPYIHCTENIYSSSHMFSCTAFNEKTFNQIEYYETRSYYFIFNIYIANLEANVDYTRFVYNLSENDLETDTISSWMNYYFLNNKENDFTFTNYDIEINGELRNDWNLLDFKGLPLTFNKNLFKDNPDFKEVCVNKTDKFIITPVDYGENNDVFMTGFIWFPYKITGFYGSTIDNDNILGENTADEYRFYFNNMKAIDEEFTEDGLQYLLRIVSYYSYENRYSYYGWSAHPFNLFYNQNNDNIYSFPYFYFDNPTMYNLDGTILDSNESLPFDDDLSYNNENICFYIRNKFDIHIMEKDLNDQDHIDLTLPGGNIHVNEDNSNFSSGLFTSITKFINEISDCLPDLKLKDFEVTFPVESINFT